MADDEQASASAVQDQQQPLGSPAAHPVALRSFHTEGVTVPARHTIENRTEALVQLVWVDWEGQENVYSVVQPGATTEQGKRNAVPAWCTRSQCTGTRRQLCTPTCPSALLAGTFSTHAWRLLAEDGALLLHYRGPSAKLTVLAPEQGGGAIVDVAVVGRASQAT